MDKEFCNICKQNVQPNLILTPETIHYAKLSCPKCGRWFKWVPSPETEGRKTTSRYDIKQIMEFHKYKCDPFCFFCLRTKEQLGTSETLTIDHIKELSKNGEDVLENLQILCFACHKLKNWMLTYHNLHFNGGKDK